MEILPILSTLRRHKFTACLLVIEIALTCAIVCNAIFLVTQRLERMHMPSGIAEKELVYIHIANIADRPDSAARSAADVEALRSIGGVQAVSLTTQLPFAGYSSNVGVKLTPTQREDSLQATDYFGEALPQTLGVRLNAGRFFRPDEYVDLSNVFAAIASGKTQNLPRSILITQAIADRLWPHENALGKTIYVGDGLAFTVIGVMAQLVRPSQLQQGAQYSTAWPIRAAVTREGELFVLRCAEQDRAEVLKAALARLKRIDPDRIVLDKGTWEEIRQNYFRNDSAMAGMLVGVCVILLVVTALGIVGLASFWVAQRRRMIGVRRALGASRSNILHYFQTENFVLASIGIALGMVLAYGINLFLMMHYELPRMPTIYFPVGALLLWGIGQIAVLGACVARGSGAAGGGDSYSVIAYYN